jgi:hypothetical protein
MELCWRYIKDLVNDLQDILKDKHPELTTVVFRVNKAIDNRDIFDFEDYIVIGSSGKIEPMPPMPLPPPPSSTKVRNTNKIRAAAPQPLP